MASSSDDILGDHHTMRVSSVCDRSICIRLQLQRHQLTFASFRYPRVQIREKNCSEPCRAFLSQKALANGDQHFHAQGNQFNCSVSMDQTHGTGSRVRARCRRPCCVELYHAVNFSAKTGRGGSRISSDLDVFVVRISGYLWNLYEWFAWHSCMSNLSPKPRAISQIRDKQAVYDATMLPLM